MVFTKISEIVEAIASLPRVCDGTRVQYPVLFKKAVCEFMLKKAITCKNLSKKVHMTSALLGKWMNQYNEGLYTIEGAYNVSRKSLDSNAIILKKLNTEINLLQRKVDLINQCKALGMKVSESS